MLTDIEITENINRISNKYSELINNDFKLLITKNNNDNQNIAIRITLEYINLPPILLEYENLITPFLSGYIDIVEKESNIQFLSVGFFSHQDIPNKTIYDCVNTLFQSKGIGILLTIIFIELCLLFKIPIIKLDDMADKPTNGCTFWQKLYFKRYYEDEPESYLFLNNNHIKDKIKCLIEKIKTYSHNILSKSSRKRNRTKSRSKSNSRSSGKRTRSNSSGKRTRTTIKKNQIKDASLSIK